MEVIDLYKDEYCYGVKRALLLVKKNISNKTYILGHLVHNSFVQDELFKNGVIEEENLDNIPSNSNLIITAHGASLRDYKIAKNKNINIIDATCPLINKIKNDIIKHLNLGYKILYIGKKDHKETKGILSLSKDIVFINNLSDIKKYENKLFVINQTTLKYEDIKILHEKILALNPSALIINSICKETLKRQEIIKNTDKLDLLIVVGDESSSNSKELYEIGKTYHKKAIFINCKDKLLNYDFNMINKIGVISGTSTPNFLKNEVINYLKNIKN